jgi:uncharacterized membrane protein
MVYFASIVLAILIGTYNRSNGRKLFVTSTVAVYGFNLLMAGIAYAILEFLLIKVNGEKSLIGKAVKINRFKDCLAPILYIIAIPMAFLNTIVSRVFFVVVAIIWIIPNKKIKKTLAEQEEI